MFDWSESWLSRPSQDEKINQAGKHIREIKQRLAETLSVEHEVETGKHKKISFAPIDEVPIITGTTDPVLFVLKTELQTGTVYVPNNKTYPAGTLLVSFRRDNISYVCNILEMTRVDIGNGFVYDSTGKLQLNLTNMVVVGDHLELKPILTGFGSYSVPTDGLFVTRNASGEWGQRYIRRAGSVIYIDENERLYRLA